VLIAAGIVWALERGFELLLLRLIPDSWFLGIGP
jgi:hypothetical protein